MLSQLFFVCFSIFLLLSLCPFVAHGLANPNVVAYFDFDPKYVKANGDVLDLTGNGHDAQLRGGAKFSPLTRLNPYANLEFTTSNSSLVVPNLPFYGFGTFFAVWMKITQDTVSSVGGVARTIAKSGGLDARCLQTLSAFYVDVNHEWNALVPLGQVMWFFTIIGFDSQGLYITIVQSDVVHVQYREQRVDFMAEPDIGFVFGSDFTVLGLIDNLYILRSNVADEQMSHEFAATLGSVAYRFTVAAPVGAAVVDNNYALDIVKHDAMLHNLDISTSSVISIATITALAVALVTVIILCIIRARQQQRTQF